MHSYQAEWLIKGPAFPIYCNWGTRRSPLKKGKHTLPMYTIYSEICKTKMTYSSWNWTIHLPKNLYRLLKKTKIIIDYLRLIIDGVQLSVNWFNWICSQAPRHFMHSYRTEVIDKDPASSFISFIFPHLSFFNISFLIYLFSGCFYFSPRIAMCFIFWNIYNASILDWSDW